MQVVSPYYINRQSIKSTINLTDSSLLSTSLPISNCHYNVAIINNLRDVTAFGVLNSKIPYKTASSQHTCRTYSTSIYNHEEDGFSNCHHSNCFQIGCKDFLDDGSKMAATNNKRYLQNKLGERKRRRPDSALMQSSEMDDSIDTSIRSRQTTRQSVQKNLTPQTICSEKSNKTEKSVLSSSGSKKHLRSNKHDIEHFCDYKELANPCSQTNDHENAVEKLLENNNDINSTTCEQNSDSLKSSINIIKNEDEVHNEEHNFDNHDIEQEGSNVCEIDNFEKISNDKVNSNNDSNSSTILSEKSSQELYQSHTATVDDYTILGYKNMNSSSVADSTNATSLISENLNQNFNLKQKSLLENSKTKEVTKNEINNKNGNNNFTPAFLCQNNSSISPHPPTGSPNDDNETNEVYENHLSRMSSSLCSDTSLSSNSCCKMSVNNSDNVSNNESKLDFEEPKKPESTTLTINLPQINSIIPQQEYDAASSQKNDQCQIFDNNDNVCSIKSHSVYSITETSAQTSYTKTHVNSNQESIRFENNDIKDSLQSENIEYRTEINNKQQEKEINLYINTEDSQNFNINKKDHNTDFCIKDNLIESSDTNTRKPDDKYEASQSTDEVSNQKQLEEDIRNTANKVYTQIEDQFHHQQHNVASISSDYGQTNSNNQQSSQVRDTNCQLHDINLSQQQDPPQQHSGHQEQHYSNAHLYQLQQDHHHQMHMHQMHKEIQLQQLHHNISHDNQRESGRQEHSHLMEFLHPQHHHSSTNLQSPLHQQQQHQIHETYHDLMMDEFPDEHHTPYKLSLSPSTVKHENQDDGYETSAGDVLTPNSHTSSTHSITPQHHLHHGTSGAGFAANFSKCEEQHPPQQQHSIHLQQSQHDCNLINEQIIHQELTPNESARNLTPRDTYHFIDDEINSPNNNNSLRNILTPPHSHSRAVNQDAGTMNGFLGMQSDVHANMINSANDMYGLTNSAVNQHLTQKQNEMESISTGAVSNSNHQRFLATGNDMASHDQDQIRNIQTKSLQKKRGRKKKIHQVGILQTLERTSLNDLNAAAGFIKVKERKKHDRFNGMSEEEIVKRILPDHLCENLDIVIIGINPGLFAAYKGHHYAGPGNHFWKCLYLSGLTQEQMSADEDFKLIKFGIGFTNMVQRATKGSADLTRKEIKEGSRILLEKLQRFRPKIAVFNGKLIFEVFSGKKDFNFGKQPECVEGTDTFIWVMPSSSARCAQLPRAADKVPFYAALKKFRDYLNGLIPNIDQSECVFTEERIKEQCDQQNFKNQQNSGETSDVYSNSIGNCNTDKLLQSNTFDPNLNAHGAGGGPGPPQTLTGDNTANTSFIMSSLAGTQQEKKKRGRPKKIKGQEIIDPLTGNKIQVNSQNRNPGCGEYNNILNLSVTQVPNSEMPKKKRGRPKKVKLPTNTLQADATESSSITIQKPNIFSIHSMTSDVMQSSPHQIQGIQQNHQQPSIYSTPPPQHQRNIYSPMSPMASPSLNCSYTRNTPPSQPNHEKLVLTANERGSSKATSDVLVTSQSSINEQNFCESPPPNSPNICAVDFNPPTATSSLSDNVNSDLNTINQQRLQSIQKSRFNSPNNSEATPDHNTNSDNFQQWLSPQHNHGVHSPTAATLVSNTMFSNSPQQTSLNYNEQQQVQAIQQQQEILGQWPLVHQNRYENGPYLLNSSVHQSQPHGSTNHHQQHPSGSDVARKSLSGLESLVDQIPTISESETISLSSAVAVNAQAAAAAAVENRLQSMQNSNNESQVGDSSQFSSLSRSSNLLTASSSPTSAASSNNQMQQSNTSTSLLNTNFSVSNLAASSASNNNIGNNNHQENYGISSNSRPLSNTNAYHHSNLMAAAVLAAAAASSPSNLSTPSSASNTATHHAQMYMDPHAHLTTHVPINSIYSATAATHHHHSAVAAHHHHSAAVHYNSAPHTATDYAANNLYPSSQSNLTAGHTLHMPSPNYPYGYATASSQSNYSAYPHTHANHHHGHPHAHHTAHHLGMFDRLKPSDITGYSGGF